MRMGSIKYKCTRSGFTLAELLVVVAIITVLAGVSIPVFAGQKEKAANTTDAANAKAIVSQLEYYYMTDPDAVAHLLSIESESPGAAEIIVTPQGMTLSTHTGGSYGFSTAADQVVAGDLKEIFGEPDIALQGKNGKSYDAYSAYQCKSTKTWKQYAVIISCYNRSTGKATTYPNIYYCSWADYAAYDGGYIWDNIISKSVCNQAFKKACGGDRIIQ